MLLNSWQDCSQVYSLLQESLHEIILVLDVVKPPEIRNSYLDSVLVSMVQ